MLMICGIQCVSTRFNVLNSNFMFHVSQFLPTIFFALQKAKLQVYMCVLYVFHFPFHILHDFARVEDLKFSSAHAAPLINY